MKKNSISKVIFEVFAFCPDGYFTPEEIKEYLYEGFNKVCQDKGIGIRIAPFTVKYKEYEKTKKS